MTVRTATADDLDDIARVAEAAWAVDYPDILTRETAEAAATEWYDHDRLAGALDAGRTLLVVAEADDAVVGFAHATCSDDEGHILRLYVHPDHRGAGHGEALLTATRDALYARGVERINAMVLAANEPGTAFYEFFGFEHAADGETTIGEETHRERRYVLEAGG